MSSRRSHAQSVSCGIGFTGTGFGDCLRSAAEAVSEQQTRRSRGRRTRLEEGPLPHAHSAQSQAWAIHYHLDEKSANRQLRADDTP